MLDSAVLASPRLLALTMRGTATTMVIYSLFNLILKIHRIGLNPLME